METRDEMSDGTRENVRETREEREESTDVVTGGVSPKESVPPVRLTQNVSLSFEHYFRISVTKIADIRGHKFTIFVVDTQKVMRK